MTSSKNCQFLPPQPSRHFPSSLPNPLPLLNKYDVTSKMVRIFNHFVLFLAAKFGVLIALQTQHHINRKNYHHKNE